MGGGSAISLIAEGLLLAVDPEQHGLLCVVALHLHHNVVLGGILFGAETQKSKSYTNTLLKEPPVQIFYSQLGCFLGGVFFRFWGGGS